ncbi:hypothetical protein A9Z42_0060890 [Trichoderma parareesei]|uniref:Uncharacterized protein n=1 Tax=Trichoderma parareesei TaxID=858221 RepID=A0A2H3A264_TRIPA|nr:hypothetical protein A9Z42_0060890 [Trichoderma parareesei]
MDPSAQAVPSSQRLGTKSRSSSGPRGTDLDSSQPWTAARCQRLLRQLQSRLASLRRLIADENPALPTGSKRASDHAQDSTVKRVRCTYGQRTKRAAPAPDKSATTPPRPVRTLGAMKLGSLSPTSEPIDFRTPVWRKIRDQIDTPAKNVEIEYGLLDSVPPELADELHSIRRHVPSDIHRIYEAIFHWLNRLLHSTALQGKHARGKSLLAMCLRKVPDCIADIDAWDRKQLKDSGVKSIWGISDAASDLFDQLEALGSPSSGWRPLRLVVRSQAVHLLSNAISDGLFKPQFCNLLVRLCVHLNGSQEAAQLAASSSRRQATELRPRPTHLGESRERSTVLVLLDSLKGKKIPGSIFECVSGLINKGLLSSVSISSRAFSGFWISSLEGLTSGNAKPHIVEFMCIAIWTLARGKRPKASDCCAIEQTLIRVAAGLAVAALTLEAQIVLGEREQRKGAWRRLVHVLECSISLIARYRSRKSPPDNASFLLVFARYLAVAQSDLASPAFKRRVSEEFETMAHRIDAVANNGVQYQQTVILLCAIIQCRRRSSAASGQELLSDVCSNLDRRKLPEWFGHGLRKDVAFMLAQKTEDLRDLTFAESLSGTTPSNAKFSTIFSGWRWEEGISEWVLPSPKQSSNRGQGEGIAITSAKLIDAEDETCSETSDEVSLISQRRKSDRILSYRARREVGVFALKKQKKMASFRMSISSADSSCETTHGCLELSGSSTRPPKAMKPFYILSQLHADFRDDIDELV